jgi:hypothetical protein
LEKYHDFLLGKLKNSGYICIRFRELSSAGSEHLPYKQGVAGSNPAVPTKIKEFTFIKCKLFFLSISLPKHVGVF